jgi:hypothetical protein
MLLGTCMDKNLESRTLKMWLSFINYPMSQTLWQYQLKGQQFGANSDHDGLSPALAAHAIFFHLHAAGASFLFRAARFPGVCVHPADVGGHYHVGHYGQDTRFAENRRYVMVQRLLRLLRKTFLLEVNQALSI